MTVDTTGLDWLRARIEHAGLDVWGTDAEWSLIEPLMPEKSIHGRWNQRVEMTDGKFVYGMRLSDARDVLKAAEDFISNKIVKYLKTGAPA